MVTIPKALDRKVKRALLRARYGWVTGFIRENLWPLFGCALVALLGAFPFYWIFASFQDLAGNYRSFRPDVYWPIAGVCFAIPLIFGLGDEFIGGWPRYNDALTALLPNCGDEPLLHELALHYPDEKVQRTAIASMQDQELLADLVRKAKNTSLGCAAKLKTGAAGELLKTLIEMGELRRRKDALNQLLEYADMLTEQEKERILRVVERDAKVLFEDKNGCPDCGHAVVYEFHTTGYYYDGYNHSDPETGKSESGYYAYRCIGCGREEQHDFTVPRYEYETERIRNLLKG